MSTELIRLLDAPEWLYRETRGEKAVTLADLWAAWVRRDLPWALGLETGTALRPVHARDFPSLYDFTSPVAGLPSAGGDVPSVAAGADLVPTPGDFPVKIMRIFQAGPRSGLSGSPDVIRSVLADIREIEPEYARRYLESAVVHTGDLLTWSRGHRINAACFTWEMLAVRLYHEERPSNGQIRRVVRWLDARVPREGWQTSALRLDLLADTGVAANPDSLDRMIRRAKSGSTPVS
jgi:hypothetical protein